MSWMQRNVVEQSHLHRRKSTNQGLKYYQAFLERWEADRSFSPVLEWTLIWLQSSFSHPHHRPVGQLLLFAVDCIERLAG